MPIWLAMASTSAWADSFRCGTYLIREGMLASEVMEKCGAPTSKEVIEEPVMARRANGSAFQVGVTTIEYWNYNLGPRVFPARLRIEEGVATKIELLHRN
ncbi:MAG TPA: DUF2845 domain-containing protein [Gammaproteobacteria bacterium]